MNFRVLFWRGEAHTSLRMFSDKRNATCGELFMHNDDFDAFQQQFGSFAEFVDKTDRAPPLDPPRRRRR